MAKAPDTAVLSKLSDSGQTVSSTDEDIRGRTVKDKDDQDVGKVDDLLIDDQEHKVRLLLVEHGGLFGIGQRKSFIPVDAITAISEEEVHISHSRDRVADAPGYDPDLVTDKTYLSTVYDHYGFAPFWGMGYGYPGYPYYPATPPKRL